VLDGPNEDLRRDALDTCSGLPLVLCLLSYDCTGLLAYLLSLLLLLLDASRCFTAPGSTP
jgi:hypothetical protein